ncbi:CLUMA_CG016377, isoform A [Clunio marinus]|uniref:CLUMA_CG016377, isoform A n=1 Tax=Clunio marinus TaxID=568069 RepID=A0A1J1IVN6_9DIPT|nr:CLUMA_CG016377, isoform A [Clunio marinus]
MKVVFCLLVCLSIAFAMPQKEGAAFSNDAIRQAQNSALIPQGATIQNVQEGIELAAYENIPGGQRINLQEILGAEVPSEVISNLQGQIDGVGRN